MNGNIEKINHLLSICSDIIHIEPEEFEKKVNEVINLSRENTYASGLYEGYFLLGRFFNIFGHFEDAVAFHEKALEIAQSEEDPLRIARSVNALGTVYDLNGIETKAQEYYRKALDICKANGFKELESTVNNNLSIFFYELGEYATSKDFLHKALDCALKANLDVAVYLRNIANNCYKSGDYTEARHYLKKAIIASRLEENNQIRGEAYLIKGLLLKDQNSDEKAKRFFEKAFKLCKETNAIQSSIDALLELSEIYDKQNQKEKALQYMKDAFSLSEINDYKISSRNIAKRMAGFFSREGQKEYERDAYRRFLELTNKLEAEGISRKKAYIKMQVSLYNAGKALTL